MAKKLTKHKQGFDTLSSIIECIKEKKSFVVEAGAGSGKTRSLVESLKYILNTEINLLEKTNSEIACITYTNVAKDEISERIDKNPLVFVGTIHEFLWYVMKNYQRELKNEILNHNNSEGDNQIPDLKKKLENFKIEYLPQYGRNFEKGRITHDDVINFSSLIFEKYPKISKIVASKYPYIFIDEYQDTEERTIDLLVRDLLLHNTGHIVLGFFGDSMQKIYEGGVGKIPENYLKNSTLQVITKEDNFRCSKAVINLLNKIRTDLVQKPAGKNLEGEILFFHTNQDNNSITNYKKVLKYLSEKKGWKNEKSKILLLTHKGIASRLGYENLLEAYSELSFGRERLTEKSDAFSEFFLDKIEKFVFDYENNNYSNFIKFLAVEGFQLQNHDDKKNISGLMVNLSSLRKTGTVREVMEYVLSNNLIAKTSKIETFEQKLALNDQDPDLQVYKKFYDKLMEVPYKEVITFYDFIEGYTPYSTKHGVKGAEFDNVLMVIDDSHKWYLYNKFNDVIGGKESSSERRQRIQNLLYVCCSRAKDKLAILSLSQMDTEAMKTLQNWFGSNIIDVSKIH